MSITMPRTADLCEQTAKMAEDAGAVSNDKVQRRLLAQSDHQTLMITLESVTTCRQVEHRETVQDPFEGWPGTRNPRLAQETPLPMSLCVSYSPSPPL